MRYTSFKRVELEVYNWVNTRYRRLQPNDRGHYPIDLMGVELGVWEGSYQNQHSDGCVGGIMRVICC